MRDCAALSIIGRVLRPSTILRVALGMRLFADAATRMGVRSVVSQTDCSPWRAFSCNDRHCLILTLARRARHKGPISLAWARKSRLTSPIAVGFCDVSWFGVGRFSVPACGSAACRAQRLSRLAEGHRSRRREAVLTAVSTARRSIGSGGPGDILQLRRHPGSITKSVRVLAGVTVAQTFPLHRR
jgi:hypothetical protein